VQLVVGGPEMPNFLVMIALSIRLALALHSEKQRQILDDLGAGAPQKG
jgi:hypothetical protein